MKHTLRAAVAALFLLTSFGAAYAAATYGGTRITEMGSGQPLPTYTVSTLPTCSATVSKNEVVVVTDATTPTYGGALTGGGAVHVLALCDGSAWAVR